jgi:glycosyltransferase involved in cell wall biosynthesis
VAYVPIMMLVPRHPEPATSARYGSYVMANRQFIVTQIGSREAYAVPRCFQEQGQLERFYTEVWCRWGVSLVERLPNPWWGLARRQHPALPPGKVVSFTLATALFELRERFGRGPRRSAVEQYEYFMRAGSHFATHVRKHLKRRKLDPQRHCFFAFSTGALESLAYVRQRGVPSVVDQLDPGRTDHTLINEECGLWPGWETLKGMPPESFFERQQQEWALADIVLVNSNFSKQAAMREGLAESKIIVVPLAYEAETASPPPRGNSAGRPLRVLWLGQIVLRKGIPYLFEAAQRLKNVEFTVAGRIGISETGLRVAPANVNVVGRVTREKALELFRNADVFVLPTISDGFALTQLEAMSHGLPVVTTPNCGDVVTPGVDGYIVPIRDPEALAGAFAKLDEDRALLAEMGRRAVEKSQQFTLGRYADAVNRAVDALAQPGQRGE